MADDFTWRDGERLVRFAGGALGEAPRMLAGTGFERFALLTTTRAKAAARELQAEADVVVDVPPGRVDEVSAEIRPRAGGRPLVALGGGRVIDCAKALAGAEGQRCGAIPTTLSGAEMTPFHRLPRGAEGARLVRPVLVVADPGLMASQPAARLAASAMNALAHAMEALYTPLRNPVAELAALRAATLIAADLPRPEPAPRALALAGLLAGYASGAAGIAVHHAVCQTIVRSCGTPHAETNAVMLPHFARLMAVRAPGAMASFASALGDPAGDPEAAAALVAKLAARSGHTRLSTLDVDRHQLAEVVEAVSGHPGLGMAPEPPSSQELLGLLERAL